jgi:hypothetical protein
VREEELVERFFTTGRPAVIVYYFVGAPQRAVLYLSPSLMDAVPVAEQRRAVESSVMQAITKGDAAGQIEAFLVQMSIRIYWMERMLGGGTVAGENTQVVVRPAKPAAKNPLIWEMLRRYVESARQFMVAGAVLAGVLLATLGVGWWLRRRARYRFPELQVEPRLGGAHAAGVGAVISFASAAVSPAAQRDQMPHDLRRA